MLLLKRVLLLVCALLFASSLIGCPEQEGPVEKAGKKVDESIEKTGEKLEEAGDKAKKETQN